MNEDKICLICLDELLDTNCVLECCNKEVHSSCIKQWWDLKNMSLDNAYCPHCQQKAKLKKKDRNYIKQHRVLPINNENSESINEYINPTFGIENLNIRPNTQFNLTDNEIISINCNSDNVIPRNNFNHNNSDDEGTETRINRVAIYLLFFLMTIFLLIFLLYFFSIN